MVRRKRTKTYFVRKLNPKADYGKLAEVQGYPLYTDEKGFDIFVHKALTGVGWVVSEYLSGMAVGVGKTRAEAVHNAAQTIHKETTEEKGGVERLHKLIAEAVKKFGYANQPKGDEKE